MNSTGKRSTGTAIGMAEPNHNNLWSVTERKGFVCLKNRKNDTSIPYCLGNSLTQRTIARFVQGVISLDVSMKDGDFGAWLQNNLVAGARIDGSQKSVVMLNASTGNQWKQQLFRLIKTPYFLRLNVILSERRGQFLLQFEWWY